jgi:hypothetical protein
MDSLVPPSHAQFEHIATVQEEKEAGHRELARKAKRASIMNDQQRQSSMEDARKAEGGDTPSPQKHKKHLSLDAFRWKRAAKVIQRTYRGYRLRREMDGLKLNASTRWISAIQEARFREATKPRARIDYPNGNGCEDAESIRRSGEEDSAIANAAVPAHNQAARDKWRRAAIIAQRAGHDDTDSDVSSISSDETGDSPEKRAERHKAREEAIAKRKEKAMMMGLQYFLEMVDQKHRYGSNLRVYHEEWMRRETHENFFYWLDYGEGRFVDMAGCPRDRLDRELVRYLSREERQYYLATIDEEGRLCWAKDGTRISTTEDYRDSIRGIVPIDDPTPPWSVPEDRPQTPDDEINSGDSSRSESSLENAREADRAAKYATPEFDGARPHRKIVNVSAATIFDKLLRKTVRKNTWIFVADTSFRLYIGIKASGAFQHSSFLAGSRISAAGLIKIKDGRLASLSPLSGHYRPPASSFRAFIRGLKEGGVDVSHVSVSKSYAVLVGLETYMRTRKKGRKMVEKLTAKKERIVAPEEVAKREEEERDKSESAAREREVLEEEARRAEEQQRREEEERRAAATRARVSEKMRSVLDGDEPGEGSLAVRQAAATTST